MYSIVIIYKVLKNVKLKKFMIQNFTKLLNYKI